jgi:hypothetical protein
MSNFQNYEDDLRETIDTASSLISQLGKGSAGEAAAIAAAADALAEATEVLDAATLASRSLSAGAAARARQSLASSEKVIGELRKDLVKAESRQREAASRADLLGGRGAASGSGLAWGGLGSDHRDEMQADTERSAHTTRLIANANKTATDAQEMGIGVAGMVSDQTEQLHHMSSRMHDINDQLSVAKRVMRGIARRVATNRLMRVCIIVVLLVSIGIIIYVGFVPDSPPPAPTPAPTLMPTAAPTLHPTPEPTPWPTTPPTF